MDILNRILIKVSVITLKDVIRHLSGERKNMNVDEKETLVSLEDVV